MRRVVTGSVIALVAIVIAIVLISGNNEQPANQRTKSQNTTQTIAQQSNTITMDANGFEPQTLIIKKGTTVNFKNIDTEEHWPASDDHPSHQIYPEFDPKKSIVPGKNWRFRFDKAGEWGFHDHLFPSFRGTITVED